MNQTLAQIKLRVRGFLSESSTRFFTEANLTQWINEAQDAIASDCPWVVQSTYQRMTVPYAESYLLPEDVIEVRATRLKTSAGSPYRVDYVEPTVMDQLKQFARSAGTTTSWRVTYRTTLDGICLEFFQPLSTRVRMTCDVFKRPVPMVNDSDVSEVPSYLTQVICDYALWKAKIKDEETAQADRARATFESDLQDLRSRRLSAQVDQMNRTRGRMAMGRWGGSS